ncbi:predicted protein [Naegleria gruberi]|uniref:Predicted protein n=1 Tax=Naegleria gruberi TaxID=5762 RepID=D2VCC0_NAEGR|nr:uncharacterized protein NAEGRDRAFT_48391 [Naegleria gruberi]EFC45725.1 predicted protein [Naegleria gruberi]|eukprot:XP_002678469.1 predicted protein [Naegleria gruberi strain NEG-M]
MKKSAFLLLLTFTWFFLISHTTCERKNALDLVTTTSPLLTQVKTGDSVVGVRTFLILFVWKSKFSNETLTKLITTNNNDSRRKYLIESVKEKGLTIGPIPDFYDYLARFFTCVNLSLSVGSSNSLDSSSYFPIYPQVDMCQRRNYFAKYDAILLDPYYFSFYLRFYRDVDMASGIYMNTADFVAIPLIPYEVYTQSTTNTVSC